VEAIVDIIRQREVGQVIVGLPVSMNGSIGGQAEKVRAFTQSLHSHIEVPVIFRDERLTTVSAKRLMKAARVKKTKGKTRDDAVAAAIILQCYLEEAYRE
jgi:putative Holliday junction resolvase